METSYFEKLRKASELSKMYSDLDLEIMIRKVLTESGFDIKLMDHVYINEHVDVPDAFGCYKCENKITAYFTNSRGDKRVKEYTDPSEFMIMFTRTALNSTK